MAGDPRSEQQIVTRFNGLRAGVEETWNKIVELESESAEHDLVVKALEPMEPSRKCYRQIGAPQLPVRWHAAGGPPRQLG
jgi:prefoldin subunit 2